MRRGRLEYIGYTLFANVLDYSVGVLPVTRADRLVDVYPEGFEALSEADEGVR